MTNHLFWGMLAAVALILTWLFVGKKDARDTLLTLVGISLEFLIVLEWDTIARISRQLYTKFVPLFKAQTSTGIRNTHPLLHTPVATVLQTHATTHIVRQAATSFQQTFLHTLAVIGESIVAEIMVVVILSMTLLIIMKWRSRLQSDCDESLACWQCGQPQIVRWYPLPDSAGQAVIPLCSDCAGRIRATK